MTDNKTVDKDMLIEELALELKNIQDQLEGRAKTQEQVLHSAIMVAGIAFPHITSSSMAKKLRNEFHDIYTIMHDLVGVVCGKDLTNEYTNYQTKLKNKNTPYPTEDGATAAQRDEALGPVGRYYAAGFDTTAANTTVPVNPHAWQNLAAPARPRRDA